MTNLLPVPVAAIHPGPASQSVAVEPSALSQVAGLLQQQAAALRSGAVTLLRAWELAAAALDATHSGAVLAATRPRTGAVLDELAGSLESLAASLRSGASRYVIADVSAAAWIP